MSEKPVIFSTPMVRALLNTKPGTWPAEPIDLGKPYKWMTRRVIKPRYKPGEAGFELSRQSLNISIVDEEGMTVREDGPAFWPGDILWVRETFTKTKGGDYIYRADPMFDGMDKGDFSWPWTSPLFLPCKAARILLEVKNVRIERVQDITEEDAKAEGAGIEWLKKWIPDNYVEPDENAHWINGYDESFSYCEKCGEKKARRLKKGNPGKDFRLDGGWDWQENDVPTYCESCGKPLTFTPTHFCVEQEYEEWKNSGLVKSDAFLLSQIIDDEGLREDFPEMDRIGFRTLWDGINAGRGYPWDKNPCVWVYEFMRVS
jgi:hypothetical protein